MDFIESIEGINLKVRESDLKIEEGNEFNPNLALIMPKVKEYYGNHVHALCLSYGTDTSNMNSYIKDFVKRLDCVNDETIYSKMKVKRKYDLIIALDACEPLRKSRKQRRKKEKKLIHNIKKLLFKDGIALFEDDVNKESLNEFKNSVIGNKFKIIITTKK